MKDKKCSIDGNVSTSKYRHHNEWLDLENYWFVLVCVILAMVLTAAHAVIPYLLGNISGGQYKSYWTCYWVTGTLDAIFAAYYFISCHIGSIFEGIISLVKFGFSKYQGDETGIE